MKLSRPSLLALSAGLSVAALSACATAPAYSDHAPASAADLHRIEVTQAAERLEVQVTKGEVALAGDERARLNAFASSYLRWGSGPIVLSSPAGGDNADTASLIAHQTRMALVEAGVPYSAVVGANYDGVGVEAAPLVLSFTRYEAHAPDCAPIWSQDLAHQSDNQPYESFGCATQANLAAMIENPRDLLLPRDEGPRDSGRRGTVMDAYRAGAPTGATRTPDESVSISTAVH